MALRTWHAGAVVGSFLIHFIIIGLSLSFGILYSELHNEFDVTQSTAAWVASLFTGLIGAVGVPVGIGISRYGEGNVAVVGAMLLCVGMLTSYFVKSFHWFYITYGLIGGLGASFCLLPSETVLMKTPIKNRALSIAISSSGSAVGSLALPPLLTYLISDYGWRGSFLILAGLALQCLPAGLLFKVKEGKGKYPEESQEDFNATSKDRPSFKSVTKDIVRNWKFMAFAVSAVLYFAILFAPSTFLPDFMKEVSFSSQQIYIVVMVMGAGQLIGRLVPGILDRWLHIDLLNGYLLTLFGGIVTSVVYVFVSSFIEFLIVSLSAGFLSG